MGHSTHEVFNIPPPLEDFNAWEADVFLRHLVEGVLTRQSETTRSDTDALMAELRKRGECAGSAELIRQGFLANANPPEFHSHDRYGHRVNLVEYHPAYHRLMADSIGQGLHCLPWRQASHVHRAALFYMQTQVEQGHICPVTMTFASVPSLRQQPDLAERWLPGILSRDYDARDLPMEEKSGLTVGMAMTEKQGGSDVRANTTRAKPLDSRGGGRCYHLTGHKFFMSAPMSDAFLFLAQAKAGLSCFLVPRWRAEGERNSLHLQKLKDKMGNVSNASSEVELCGAEGWLIGEEGRGLVTILEMVGLTRFDCMLASAAAMRQAVVQAVHHCRHRQAFGKWLIEQPLMKNVLADLIIESDAALALAIRMAQALDRQADPAENALLRLGTAVGKYWICKRTPGHNYEAMECLGGNGVMNEFMTARLYREAPINAIWEGSGNIQALDVLRVMERQPECLEALRQELGRSQGMDARLDQHLTRLYDLLENADDPAYRARTLVENIALAWQAALLLRSGDSRVAEAFIAARLAAPAGLYGNLPSGVDANGIVARALPGSG